MPTQTNLAGLGLPGEQAAVLGNEPTAINGAGTTQATATAITTHLVQVTGAASQTGAILPAAAKLGTTYYVASVGGTAVVVYPPVGHSLNASLNTGLTVSAATGTGIFIQTSRTKWWVFPSGTWS